MIGSAVRVIRLPKALTAWAAQSLRKSGWRQSPVDGHHEAGARIGAESREALRLEDGLQAEEGRERVGDDEGRDRGREAGEPPLRLEPSAKA